MVLDGEGAQGKRRRLLQLVGVKHATPAAVSEIVARLGDTHLPPTSAWVLRDVVRSEFDKFGMSVVLPYESGGGAFTWSIARLDKVIQRFADQSVAFRDALRRAAGEARERGGPLRLCFYGDEVTPGNVLALQVLRKFWAFYVTFFDFESLLSKEAFWIPVAVLRASIASKIVGGISGCVGKLLHAIFDPPANMAQGFVVNLPEPTLICATFHVLLADGEADRACWSCKGAAGIRPCVVCRNCVIERYADPPGLYPISWSDFSAFDVADDNSMWEAIDILSGAAGTVSNDQFALLERSLGFTHRRGSLLQDISLRGLIKPATSHRYGPMHTLVHNGIATFEFARFFRACQQELPSFSYATVREFLMADWRFPRHGGARVSHQSRVQAMFSAKREKELASLTFKANASDILDMYALIRMFGQTCVRPLGVLQRELASLEAMCAVLDCYVAIKRGETVTGFAAAVSEALELHVAAYGGDKMRPKHHWALHLPRQYEADGNRLIDEFALERKHKGIKAFADSLNNTLSFERTLVSNAILEQERCLSGLLVDDRLCAPHDASPMLRQLFSGTDVRMSKSMVLRNNTIGAEDIVFIDGIAVLVVACAKVGLQLGVVGWEMTFVSKTSNSSSTWRDPHNRLAVALMSEHTLSMPFAWTFVGDRTCEILHR